MRTLFAVTLCWGLTCLSTAHALLRPLGPEVKHREKNSDISLVHSTKCAELIAHFERTYEIPEHLMQAIAMVESQKSPYAIFAGGSSTFLKRRSDAIAHVEKMRKKGVQIINVGCMQIDLQTHLRNIGSIEKALTPYYNIQFAAKLLRKLYKQHGSWEKAVRYYHSSSSTYNIAYKNKVFARWALTLGKTFNASEGDPTWVPKHASHGHEHRPIKGIIGFAVNKK
jgi:hypothetical protein